jgi:hypothetical protein
VSTRGTRLKDATAEVYPRRRGQEPVASCIPGRWLGREQDPVIEHRDRLPRYVVRPADSSSGRLPPFFLAAV